MKRFVKWLAVVAPLACLSMIPVLPNCGL